MPLVRSKIYGSNRYRLRAGLLFLFLSGLAGPGWAKVGKPAWSGNIGLGASSSTGTSQSLSANTQDALHWHEGQWEDSAHLDYNYAQSQGIVDADRLVLQNQARYLFTPAEYAFGNLRYDRNHFDGYYYRMDETLGYGRRWHPHRDMRLDLEAGAGAREAHRIGSRSHLRPILRLHGRYQWNLDRHAAFSQSVDAILASNGANTYESVTALRSQVYGPLAMKLSYTATYNTQVPISYQKLNTLAAVNLVYNF